MKRTPSTPFVETTPDNVANPNRRETLKATSALLLCAGLGIGRNALADDDANSKPKVGDQLARTDAEGKAQPLRCNEIQADAKPVAAFPFEPASGEVRDGSRLNKVILVRVDPQELTDETRAYAAGGVLAYSAVCTHQGCEVSEWVAKDKTLMCYCHFSKFSPSQGGQVVAGPAPRTLPLLPLKEENGVLVVAGPFTSHPGVAKSA
ncbi:ubiquinol-cytochrome c reductase iron-sulfur subunit [Zoogloea sp. LCSB751]|uniref:QcrA and Rieske domain-containing protein n=1 Tax=Zoogloea sp. LCSB751 TaxID=1965277 RepID=UPI000B49681F|nr:Rieske (2Fe-2S) protein [Zoogloea sp. LCSB751]